MHMTKDEITAMYRDAADPVRQRGILAELNACTVSDIDRILVEAGMEVDLTKHPKKRKTTNNKDAKYLIDKDVAKFFSEGLSPMEIAERVGVTRTTVYNSLKRQGITLMKPEGSRQKEQQPAKQDDSKEQAPSVSWNAHMCLDMPKDTVIVKDKDGDPMILADKQSLPHINLCPWCGAKLVTM